MPVLTGAATTPGIFVTGTDTGVGKTVVSATLARLLSRTGLKVGVMKPVTSGCPERDGSLASPDAELLCWGAGTPCLPDCAPYLLRAPLAPSAAAALEGVRICLQKIVAAYHRVCQNCDFIIVEGAGGLMVPLYREILISDLAKALGLPLLVVARPALGTVNHTLLTTFGARKLGLQVAGVVINRYSDQPGEAEVSAPPLIEALSGAPLVTIFPEVCGADERELVTRLAARLHQEPQLQKLLQALAPR